MLKVSIIIPVYNVASYITACMESIYAQTLSSIEVIFVDDRGQDDSVQIIAGYIASHQLEPS
ncbi:MAG: glycosyltransferase, partial [Paludibacteraceae bacterium]|nr:glycosyltransferase [Paludibacteraceae bacterium]